jgi:hypothetical protein
MPVLLSSSESLIDFANDAMSKFNKTEIKVAPARADELAANKTIGLHQEMILMTLNAPEKRGAFFCHLITLSFHKNHGWHC